LGDVWFFGRIRCGVDFCGEGVDGVRVAGGDHEVVKHVILNKNIAFSIMSLINIK
jgi:hypothetical protein